MLASRIGPTHEAPHSSQRVRPTPYILYLCAAPRGARRLDFEREALAISAAIEVGGRKAFRLYPVFDVRLVDLQELLRIYKPAIVHISGHGVREAPRPDGGARPYRPPDADPALKLLDGAGDSAQLSPELLHDILQCNLGSIRGVVLNACHSQAHAETITRVVDFAVGTTGAISDLAAIAFASSFYGKLADGDTLAHAIQSGQLQIAATQTGPATIIAEKYRKDSAAATIRLIAETATAPPPPPLLDDLLKSILTGIDNVHTRTLTAAFSRAAPRDWSAPLAARKDQSWALILAKELVDAPTPVDEAEPHKDALHPLLTFLKLLAVEDRQPAPALPLETRIRLGHWLQTEGVPRLGERGRDTREDLLGKLRKVAWSFPDVHLHLRIQRQPAGTYTLEAYREGELQDDPRTELDQAALELAVAELVTSAASEVDRDHLMIEIFAARPCLAMTIDQWHYYDREWEEHRPLGLAGRLVLRDAVRSGTPSMHNRCKQVWDSFRAVAADHPFTTLDYSEGAVNDGAVACFLRPAGNREALRDALRASPIVCALFADPTLLESLLVPVLLAAVPVALWARPSCDAALRGEVRKLLEAGPLAQLPERVRSLRASGDELGKHLTLIWDDPTDPWEGGSFPGPGR